MTNEDRTTNQVVGRGSSNEQPTTSCPLCGPAGETVLWQNDRCRIVLVADPAYAGYCRVIWNTHIKEMTDLALEDRHSLMSIVLTVEEILRELLQPAKINLAALGNMVPHLHWHVIPRFTDDPHFPDAIWAAQRHVGAARSLDMNELVQRLEARLDRSS